MCLLSANILQIASTDFKKYPKSQNYSVLYKTLIISRIDENEREFLTPTVDEEDAGVRVVGGGGSSGTMEARFVENI